MRYSISNLNFSPLAFLRWLSFAFLIIVAPQIMEALVDQRIDHPLAFDLHASDAVPLMTSKYLGVVCGCSNSIET